MNSDNLKGVLQQFVSRPPPRSRARGWELPLGTGKVIGHKLETAVFLHLRRKHREFYYQTDGTELDLCNEQGTAFWNSCWNLAGPDTLARELAAMKMGSSRTRKATGKQTMRMMGRHLKAESAGIVGFGQVPL